MTTFNITVKKLQSLFEFPQNKDGTSKKLLAEMGGPKKILELINVDPTSGINHNDKEDLNKREEYFGKNVLASEPLHEFSHFFIEQCSDINILILVYGSLIMIAMSFFSNHPLNIQLESGIVLFSCFCIVMMGAILDYKKERNFFETQERLNKVRINVFRNKKMIELDQSELLVGDIIEIGAGDILSCDMICVQKDTELDCDEQSLTGKSDNIQKVII